LPKGRTPENSKRKPQDRTTDMFNKLGTLARRMFGYSTAHNGRAIKELREWLASRLTQLLDKLHLLPPDEPALEFMVWVRVLRDEFVSIIAAKSEDEKIRMDYSDGFKEAVLTLAGGEALRAIKTAAQKLGIFIERVKVEEKVRIKAETCEGGTMEDYAVLRQLQEAKALNAALEARNAALEMKLTEANAVIRKLDPKGCAGYIEQVDPAPEPCSPGTGKCPDVSTSDGQDGSESSDGEDDEDEDEDEGGEHGEHVKRRKLASTLEVEPMTCPAPQGAAPSRPPAPVQFDALDLAEAEGLGLASFDLEGTLANGECESPEDAAWYQTVMAASASGAVQPPGPFL
jgi:hypothetical protein